MRRAQGRAQPALPRGQALPPPAAAPVSPSCARGCKTGGGKKKKPANGCGPFKTCPLPFSSLRPFQSARTKCRGRRGVEKPRRPRKGETEKARSEEKEASTNDPLVLSPEGISSWTQGQGENTPPRPGAARPREVRLCSTARRFVSTPPTPGPPPTSSPFCSRRLRAVRRRLERLEGGRGRAPSCALLVVGGFGPRRHPM